MEEINSDEEPHGFDACHSWLRPAPNFSCYFWQQSLLYYEPFGTKTDRGSKIQRQIQASAERITGAEMFIKKTQGANTNLSLSL